MLEVLTLFELKVMEIRKQAFINAVMAAVKKRQKKLTFANCCYLQEMLTKFGHWFFLLLIFFQFSFSLGDCDCSISFLRIIFCYVI